MLHTSRILPGKPGFMFNEVQNRFVSVPSEENLATHLQSVYEHLGDLKCTGAATRLSELDDYAKRTLYNPAEVLTRTDLDNIRGEIDDVSAKWARRWSALRNIFALLPLLVTWITLGIATSAYQTYYTDHSQSGKNDVIVQPFIVAWQSGFDHRLSFTFADVATFDAILLFIVIVLTFLTHWTEGRAFKKADERFQKVVEVVNRYVNALYADRDKSRWDPGASPQQWAERAQELITSTMQKVETTITGAQKIVTDAATVLGDFPNVTRDLFNQFDARIEKMLGNTEQTLRDTVDDLRSELRTYTDSTTKLLESVDKVKEASQALKENVEGYTDLATSIDDHVKLLQASQAGLVTKMSDAADRIGVVAKTFNDDGLRTLTSSVTEAARQVQDELIAGAEAQRNLYEASAQLLEAARNIAGRTRFRQSPPPPTPGQNGGPGATPPVSPAPRRNPIGGFFRGVFGRGR